MHLVTFPQQLYNQAVLEPEEMKRRQTDLVKIKIHQY